MKRWVSKLPLRGKLVLLVAIATIVALSISGAVLTYYAHDTSDRALRHRLETQVRMIALNSSAAIAFEDLEAARNTLKTLAGDGAILSADITLPDGTVFVEQVFADQSSDEIRARRDVDLDGLLRELGVCKLVPVRVEVSLYRFDSSLR